MPEMSKVNILIEDAEDVPNAVYLSVYFDVVEPDRPAPSCAMMALTIKRLFESGELSKMVPVICADLFEKEEKEKNDDDT